MGESPYAPADTSGLAFISDFNIKEGTVRKPPAGYNFPDLSARINAVIASEQLLNAFLFAQAALDIAAAIFPSDHIPNLNARIFALLQSDLGAEIFGTLMYRDLLATIVTRAIYNSDLPAKVNPLYTRDIVASIGSHAPANLGAIIWSPADLHAIMGFIYHSDIPANIFAQQHRDLPARMLGIASPSFRASIRGQSSTYSNLPAATFGPPGDLPASVTATYPGPNDFLGLITALGQSSNLRATITNLSPGKSNLPALLNGYDQLDLAATIQFLGAYNLRGVVGTIPFGAKNAELAAFAHGLIPVDLGAMMTTNVNTAALNATISALHDKRDLGAFLRCAETFITTILTITTLSSRDLRAIIGKPECAGGTAIRELAAFAQVQHAANLRAFVESHYESNLAASINTRNIIHALDTINVRYTPTVDRKLANKIFRATDTIQIRYSPFRGQDLSAAISAIPAHAELSATIKAGFPLIRVTPAISRILSADIRGQNPLNIQEIRLQLEGSFLEFLYVNGTDQAFISDSNQTWSINVRSFKPIASNLFGDFAAARVCRVGALQSFESIDEAVRFCIAMVLGLQGQASVGASIVAHGQIAQLPATVRVSNRFKDLTARAGRVYPFDMEASINSTGDKLNLTALIEGVSTTRTDLGASIAQVSDDSLSAIITAV